MAKKETKKTNEKETKTENASCTDDQCPIHGNLKTRGRIFKGYIIKKFPKRIVIEFERVVLIRKYERFMKKKTKLHARLPSCQESKVNVGDYVSIQECRPLSKITKFAFIEKIRGKEEETKK